MTNILRDPEPVDLLAQGTLVIDQLVKSLLIPVTSAPRAVHGPQYVRALFISDLHLGSKGCRALDLVSFLRQYRTSHLYLVGDIFDTWRPMGKNWTREHDEVVRTILDMHHAGAKLTYVPGNHDALFHRFHGHHFGTVTIAPRTMHTTANGQRLLVIHGDSCDVFSESAPWLAQIGATFESGLRYLSDRINSQLTRAGRPQWTGIEDLVNKVNQTVRKHDRFEQRLSALAQRNGADGIVCGHFHQPALHRNFGVTYANCGDWVENQTAIVEAEDGSLDLIDWSATTAATGARYPAPGQQKGLAAAN